MANPWEAVRYGAQPQQQNWGSLGGSWGSQAQYATPLADSAGGVPSLPSMGDQLLNTDTAGLANAPQGMENSWGNLFGALGSTNQKTGIRSDGWGGMALGVGQGLAGAFLGAKQFSLAQDSLNENKRQFQLNYDNQRKTMNTELEDRQRARVASNSGAYQSVGDYMQKNGV